MRVWQRIPQGINVCKGQRRQGQGTYDCLSGTMPGRGGQAGRARAGQPGPEIREGERVAVDGVLREVGVPRALQLRSAADILQEPVDGECCSRGWGHVAEEEALSVEQGEESSRAAAADVLPELTFCDATEVALHRDARFWGGLPLERPVGECTLDGTRVQCVRLGEVIEDGAVRALKVGLAAGVVGSRAGVFVRLVEAELRFQQQGTLVMQDGGPLEVLREGHGPRGGCGGSTGGEAMCLLVEEGQQVLGLDVMLGWDRKLTVLAEAQQVGAEATPQKLQDRKLGWEPGAATEQGGGAVR